MLPPLAHPTLLLLRQREKSKQDAIVHNVELNALEWLGEANRILFEDPGCPSLLPI